MPKGIVVGTVTQTRAGRRGGQPGCDHGREERQASDEHDQRDQPDGRPVISCSVLHLVLGPLDLDLLGLVVHLDRVVLDITAVPAGGLLGQLLCAVANLLSGGLGGLLGQLATLLNQILGQLGL